MAESRLLCSLSHPCVIYSYKLLGQKKGEMRLDSYVMKVSLNCKCNFPQLRKDARKAQLYQMLSIHVHMISESLMYCPHESGD